MEAIGTAEAETSARSIDILVSRLRKKLGEDAGNLIETARGHGYRFSGRVTTGN
jgi:DNA-binding response OmpR family regulator